MTVDRTHVLATPCMDAHSSYVALSRHRDGMDLHYGQDDFANPDRLVRTLSRDRAKDMASDYEQRDPAQSYAERRGSPSASAWPKLSGRSCRRKCATCSIYDPHANSIRHSTLGRAPSGQLFRHDEARHRTAGAGRGLLLHRQLPFHDLALRPRPAPAEHPRCRPGFPGLRTGPRQDPLVPPIRCPRRHRTGLDSDHRHPHGPAGTMPQLQGQIGPRHFPQPRPLRLSGPHGRRHFDLRFQPRPRRPRPEAARRSHPRHRHQIQRSLRPDLCRARTAHPRRDGRRARLRRRRK